MNFVNKFIFRNFDVNSKLSFHFNNLAAVLFLLIFNVFIYDKIKLREWLHWKYEYT